MPQNFDFGTQWATVVSHLLTTEADNIIATTFTYWASGRGINHEYDPSQPPSQELSSTDHSLRIQDLIQEHFKHLLSRESVEEIERLHEEKNALDSDAEDFETEDYNDALAEAYEESRDEITERAGYNWPKHKDKLAFYVPVGSCHAWNAIFGLWLARKVFPDKQWLVLRSDKHTTVYCPAIDQVFDILYWALERRLDDHICGAAYSSSDLSLGGNLAFNDSQTFVPG